MSLSKMLGLSAMCVIALALICLPIGDGEAPRAGLARSWDVSRRRCPPTARFGAGDGAACHNIHMDNSHGVPEFAGLRDTVKEDNRFEPPPGCAVTGPKPFKINLRPSQQQLSEQPLGGAHSSCHPHAMQWLIYPVGFLNSTVTVGDVDGMGLSRADGTASEGRNCERRLAAPVQLADGGGASHNGLAYFLEQPISKNPTLWVTRLLGLSNVCVFVFIGVLIWCCWRSRVGAVDGGARSSSQVFAAWHGIAGGDVRVYRNAVLTGEPGVSCSEDGRALIYPRHVGQAGRHGERACERARRAWRRSCGLAAGGEGEGRMESNVHHMRVCSGLEFFREAARWRSIAGSEPAPVPAGRIC